MQPDKSPDQWRQPSDQPTRSPYAEPAPEQPDGPMVTLSPDESTPQHAWQTEPLQPDEQKANEPAIEPALAPVRWQAHEYINHAKTPGWFIVFALVCIGLILLAIFVIKSITFAILIPVMAVALIVYSNRPPRLLEYTLSRQGLHVNDRLYSINEFKSFGVIHDGDEYSVFLVPVKRFRPGLTVYFPEDAGEAIVDMLAARLPMKELHLDVVDQLIRKLRL